MKYSTILKDYLNSFVNKKIVVLGDSMFDEYLLGKVHRISPEAPVPVLNLQERKLFLGGAANVANNIRSLGGNPFLLSLAGDDDYAFLLREMLEEKNVEHHIEGIEGFPTTLKTRVMASSGHQIVRVDSERFFEVDSDSFRVILAVLEREMEDVDVLILSDYGKGMFSAVMMDALEELWTKLGRKPKIIVDPKVLNMDLYKNVFILTPNSVETSQYTGISIDSDVELQNAAGYIFDRLSCDHVLTTLGSEGMALFDSQYVYKRIATVAQTVFDVTGAGDTVCAMLGLALSNGVPLLESAMLANCAAGCAIGSLGATAVSFEQVYDTIDIYSKKLQEAFLT
ncbi:MAG: bifunctional heptose 7-phosphate kinase/heptose 1-phosphate adenyltransferase [Desulfovibrionaceae bacterium]